MSPFRRSLHVLCAAEKILGTPNAATGIPRAVGLSFSDSVLKI